MVDLTRRTFIQGVTAAVTAVLGGVDLAHADRPAGASSGAWRVVNAVLNIERDMADATGVGDNSRTYAAVGMMRCTVELELRRGAGLESGPAVTLGALDLADLRSSCFDLIASGATIPVNITANRAPLGPANPRYSMNALITHFESEGDDSVFLRLQASGDVTRRAA